MNSYHLNLNPIFQLTEDKFYQLCRYNPEIKFERNLKGEIIIMSPTGGQTGNRNIEIAADFVFWNRQYKLGKLFDSSTCFQLPNGANRSPDISWIKQERWEKLSSQEQEKFPPLAPDFVLELMSPSDKLKDTQDKMKEYIHNGVQLGWLINRKQRQVEIYRQGKNTEILHNPVILSGENILPQFTLNMDVVW